MGKQSKSPNFKKLFHIVLHATGITYLFYNRKNTPRVILNHFYKNCPFCNKLLALKSLGFCSYCQKQIFIPQDNSRYENHIHTLKVMLQNRLSYQGYLRLEINQIQYKIKEYNQQILYGTEYLEILNQKLSREIEKVGEKHD
jgi:hypothetical protein